MMGRKRSAGIAHVVLTGDAGVSSLGSVLGPGAAGIAAKERSRVPESACTPEEKVASLAYRLGVPAAGVAAAVPLPFLRGRLGSALWANVVLTVDAGESSFAGGTAPVAKIAAVYTAGVARVVGSPNEHMPHTAPLLGILGTCRGRATPRTHIVLAEYAHVSSEVCLPHGPAQVALVGVGEIAHTVCAPGQRVSRCTDQLLLRRTWGWPAILADIVLAGHAGVPRSARGPCGSSADVA